MFLKNLKNSTFPKLVASRFHTSLPSQYTVPKAPIDLSLLSPFDKSKTFQALNQAHQATVNQKSAFKPFDIDILDKTGSTPYSQTFRAYDKESNVLFAQKKLFLDSASSWNQLNLILKQYTIQSPHLASIYSINFDQTNQEVNVMSQVNKNTVGDYSHFMAKQDIKWTDELLMSCTQQILSQLKVLRSLSAHCQETIKPQNMFIDEISQNLKVFDFSDFHVVTESSEITGDQQRNVSLDIALQTLVQALNPDVHVGSIEEARMYLSRSHPSFYNIIKQGLILNPLHVVSDYNAFISKKLGLFGKNSTSTPNEAKTGEEDIEYWRQFKENIEAGYVKQIETHNLSGNQKLMAETYERLLTIQEEILKAQKEAHLNPPQDPLAQEKESFAYSLMSSLLSFTAHMIQAMLFMFLILAFIWAFFMALAAIIVAGDKIYQPRQPVSPSSAAVKEENNLDQNDGKTDT